MGKGDIWSLGVVIMEALYGKSVVEEIINKYEEKTQFHMCNS